MRRRKKYNIAAAVITAMILLLNLFGCSSAFCDWYRAHIYRWIADGYGHLTDLLPFALGEVLMYAGILMAAAAVVCAAAALVKAAVRRPGRKKTGREKTGRENAGRSRAGSRFICCYLKVFLMTLLVLLLIYTVNWILPLRASQISFDVAEDRTYSITELEELRAFMVNHLNRAAEEVERDADGHVVYITGSERDEAVADAMRDLTDEFPLLAGFYPQNKTAMCSAVLDWMDIGGFTYPYTMELTTSRYVTGLYAPMLLAHEESHHKGYYLESEANYLAYRALSASSDLRLQYAAYENMYYYVNSAYVKSLRQVMTDDELKTYYQTQPQRSDLVKADEAAAQAEVDADYESSVSSTATEKLAPAASAAADKGWAVQAQALGDACYDGVVEMLLKYYYK